MYVLYFWLILIFAFLIINIPIYVGDAKHTRPSGPYKAMLMNITKCENLSRPYMTDSPFYATLTIHNTSNAVLLSGNVSVLRDTRNVKHKLRGYVIEDGRWKPNFMINDIGCRSILLYYICVAAGVKYDRKSCTFFKGQYIFKNLDVNYIEHLHASKMEYAKMLWIFESYNTKLGTLLCEEFHTVTEPDYS